MGRIRYTHDEELLHSFYLSKRFKKIKKLVYNDLFPLTKFQLVKILIYNFNVKLHNKFIKFLFKSKKKLKNRYQLSQLKLFETLTEDKLNYNKFILDYYNSYIKNDNTIFDISWTSFWYSIALMIIGKIISDIDFIGLFSYIF